MQVPENYLLNRVESALKHASDMNLRGVQVSLDIGKEKTQFFEKIALASGGTIALVVSFVGAHAGRLQPPWLLRSSLVALVLSMVGAAYRNWRFPFYLLANYDRQYLEAKRESIRRESEYFNNAPDTVPVANERDWKPRGQFLDEYNQQFAEAEKEFVRTIGVCKRQEDRSFRTVQVFEYITVC